MLLLNKFTSINESLGDINARISIIENDHKKIQIDQSEKILTNENNIISNTNRIAALEMELAHEKMANNILARSVDNLDQAGRNMNMFVAGLSPEQATKEGFLQFCSEKLLVPVEIEDIKSVFKIPSEKESLYKFIYKNHEVREKFYTKRRLLKDCPSIWFRDDLTKMRELLAREIRIMVKNNLVKKCWTDHGAVLILRNGENKPTRINDLSEI